MERKKRIESILLKNFKEWDIKVNDTSILHKGHNFFTGNEECLAVCSVVIVGLRLPNDSLFRRLTSSSDNPEQRNIRSIERVGDCLAPGAIMHAVYSGHSWARNLGCVSTEDNYLRDLPVSINPPGAAIRKFND